MVAISARSRSPATLSIEIDSSSAPGLVVAEDRSPADPDDVFAVSGPTLPGWYRGMPPETIQSKHLLIAERCCLTEGRERGICSTYAATCMGLMAASRCSPRRCSHQSMNRETAR